MQGCRNLQFVKKKKNAVFAKHRKQSSIIQGMPGILKKYAPNQASNLEEKLDVEERNCIL